MVNVVFLLLVFFLMTATIAPPAPVEVTPPEGRGPAAAAAADALWLAADGTVAFGELRGSVAVAAAAASGGPVELRADAGASPADLARLLAALAAAGAPGAALVLREAP
jgi:biopolymer transport protein ExbD